MFTIGQKVVCVKPTPSGSIQEREVYTISGFVRCSYTWEWGLKLKEATPANGFYGFSYWRFREIDTTFVDELLFNTIKEPTTTT